MINAIKKLFVLGCLFTAAGVVYAQVAPSVYGGEGSLWAGGEYSVFSPDFGTEHLNGIGASFDLNVTPRFGAVGEARWLHWHNSVDGGETQSDYLAGGKYRFYRWNRFDFDAKFLVGGVWIKFPNGVGTGSYFAYAPGVFADYRLKPRWRIRGSYEYQMLPSAPNIPGSPTNGMTPHGFSVGVEYNAIR
ncbi:MAG TPA: outer membrane beta-barrel protein [Acidobacteriaceae bacterium]|nr:outer membrane beta-barrel protein [Acidobacteriaceae bacterium]